MASKFGTPEWASALVSEINGSSEYRNAAKSWGDGFNGNMIFVFEADEQLASPLHLFIELATGSCTGAEFVDRDVHEGAGFTLRAPFTLWREILERKTMAATAILTGKMKVDGGKMTLLKHTAANRALIHCTASVETEF
ncbi:MAG: SCP2 sterol-binding domain-containing protein [Candidatus Eisenbacteria bacterium]